MLATLVKESPSVPSLSMDDFIYYYINGVLPPYTWVLAKRYPWSQRTRALNLLNGTKGYKQCE